MLTEQSQELCRRYFAKILTGGNLGLIDLLLAPDVGFYIPTIPGGVHGWDGVKGFVTTLRTAFPDGVFAPEPDGVIVDGNKAAARWSFKGHTVARS